MLTWINEKAKWIIVIFAAGIVVGLLAMDRVPNQGHSYPVGVVNDKKITYAEFDSRIKNIVQNQYQGQHLEDEQYNQLRTEVFRSFVRQILLNEQFEKAELSASVAELESEFSRNPDAVRARLVQEAQRYLYMIQQQATSQEDLMQRSQAYIASLPKFLTDSTFNKEEYDAWLKTPEAFRWGVMLQLEEDLKVNTIPMRQLQALVGASVHATSLEAGWAVNRRLTDYELQVAVASNNDFKVDENSVDSVMVAVEGPGKYAVKLKTQQINALFVKKLAAGSIFTGSMGNINLTKLTATLKWGIPFTLRPQALEGYACYMPKTINVANDPYKDKKGTLDNGHVAVYLTDWDKQFTVDPGKGRFVDPEDEHIIGYGIITFDSIMNGYEKFTIPIEYYDDRTPRYVVVVGSSSSFGDYFTGGEGSTLWLDEFRFVY